MKRGRYSNVVRTIVDGITFASKLEAKRYRELKLLAHVGDITDLVLQPPYVLVPAFTDRDGKRHRQLLYRGDFGYCEQGREVCEDVKGNILTREFRIKEKLLRYVYPDLVFRVVKER